MAALSLNKLKFLNLLHWLPQKQCTPGEFKTGILEIMACTKLSEQIRLHLSSLSKQKLFCRSFEICSHEKNENQSEKKTEKKTRELIRDSTNRFLTSSERNEWYESQNQGCAAQFFLAQTDHQILGIFSMVKCVQTTQHKTNQKTHANQLISGKFFS